MRFQSEMHCAAMLALSLSCNLALADEVADFYKVTISCPQVDIAPGRVSMRVFRGLELAHCQLQGSPSLTIS